MKRIIDISEEDYNFLIEHKDEYNYERTRIAPILNSTPLTECEAEDCIDREYTTKYVEEFANNEYVSEHEAETIYFIAEGIRHIPSVYPKSDKPSGKWERHYSRPNVYADLYWHCSVCGGKNPNNDAYLYHKFCPYCGALMNGEEQVNE